MFMYNIILFVYYFTDTTFGLQCWQCISNDCDGDPEKNLKAEKVTCKKDGSCLVRVMKVKVKSCSCVLLKGKSCYTSFLCHIYNHKILSGMYHCIIPMTLASFTCYRVHGINVRENRRDNPDTMTTPGT